METIHIEGSEDTPRILFDPQASDYSITGRSLPEDVLTFYAPVMQWLDRFFGTQPPKLELRIDLDYFNTASSKILLDIFMKLEDAHEQGKAVSVTWVHKATDPDMHEAGIEYAELVTVPFAMVAK